MEDIKNDISIYFQEKLTETNLERIIENKTEYDK